MPPLSSSWCEIRSSVRPQGWIRPRGRGREPFRTRNELDSRPRFDACRERAWRIRSPCYARGFCTIPMMDVPTGRFSQRRICDSVQVTPLRMVLSSGGAGSIST
jgi:hypothetical protein